MSAALPLDLGLLPGLISYNVWKTQVELSRDFSHRITSGDIRPATVSLMFLVEANPGIAQIDIAHHLEVDTAYVVVLVRTLLDRQDVVCRKCAEDRRRQGIYLTEKGRKGLSVLRRAVLRHETRFTRLFTVEELSQLLALLRRLYD